MTKQTSNARGSYHINKIVMDDVIDDGSKKRQQWCTRYAAQSQPRNTPEGT